MMHTLNPCPPQVSRLQETYFKSSPGSNFCYKIALANQLFFPLSPLLTYEVDTIACLPNEVLMVNTKARKHSSGFISNLQSSRVPGSWIAYSRRSLVKMSITVKARFTTWKELGISCKKAERDPVDRVLIQQPAMEHILSRSLDFNQRQVL